MSPTSFPLLSGSQVCEALGISSRTLDRMIADKELPPTHRIRGRNRWLKSLVTAYQEAHTIDKEVS